MSANNIENVCENMLTHVHKVIHLVVSTFEQGWISWWIEGGVFHFQTVTGRWSRGDRTRGSSVRSIIKEGGSLGLRPDTGDQTLVEHCLASGPADVAAHREEGE